MSFAVEADLENDWSNLRVKIISHAICSLSHPLYQTDFPFIGVFCQNEVGKKSTQFVQSVPAAMVLRDHDDGELWAAGPLL